MFRAFGSFFCPFLLLLVSIFKEKYQSIDRFTLERKLA
jgi:hypothetical protein